MKKEVFREIEIPQDVKIELAENTLSVKGPAGESRRTFKVKKFSLEKKGNKIVIGAENATKREKKMINTLASHIKNMISGVQKKFEYKLKICFTHFPISVEIKDNQFLIKNFLGEKIPRKSKILPEVDAKIEEDIITVSSHDKEAAGQTAANLETATKIGRRDLRIFQDGIFIINKAGREI